MPKKEMSESEAFDSAVKFSNRYVDRGPYEFFPEKTVVEEVQKGLADNHRIKGYRYCPWMPLSGDPVEDRKKICPCERHHEDIERDGFCIWMFFVSEEFLRKYESGEDFNQTIDEAVPLGTELFENTGGKKEFNTKKRKKNTDDLSKKWN